MNGAARIVLPSVIALAAGTARADWHSGRIIQVRSAYDGTPIMANIDETSCKVIALFEAD